MTLWRSLSFRLAVTYAILFTGSVAILLALFYWVSVERPTDQLRARINLESEEYSQIYMLEGQARLIASLSQQAQRPTRPKFFAAFIASDGRRSLYNLPALPHAVTSDWATIDADIYREGLELDQLALLRTRRFADGAVLMVGRDNEDVNEISEQIEIAATWVIPVTLLLGMLGGFLMARAIGRRVEGIAGTARQVMAGNLAGRVPVTGANDDFDALSETLNTMLAQLEANFESIKRVSDHVAHELRTPLARMVLALEEAAAGEDAERADRIAGSIEEARRLERIVGALLRISRIEVREHAIAGRPVNLATLVEDVIEYYAPVAEQNGLALSLQTDKHATIPGDRDLLFQAVSNLVDNAVKFSPAGGSVTVALLGTGNDIVVTVTDTGRGIREDEIDRLSERFFRGKAAQGAAGDGLGLSLVAAIVTLHGGTLQWTRLDPGLRVELSFPGFAAH